MNTNTNENKSQDLLINDIFYWTNGEETRIPYEVLSGTRILKPEDEEIRDWFQENSKFKIEYVHRGRCICVEHGRYLESIALYVKKDAAVPKNTRRIKQKLYEHFRFPEIDSTVHQEWGITPEQAIFFIKLEDELKSRVDDFIYDKMKRKAEQLGAHFEFTCLDLAMRWNHEYEYRVCYPSQEELNKHDCDGSNQAFAQEIERLMSRNNYFGIYDDISPGVRFMIKEGI